MNCKVIAIENQKGGTGKSTTAFNPECKALSMVSFVPWLCLFQNDMTDGTRYCKQNV